MSAVPQLKKTQSSPQSLLSGATVGKRNRIRVFFRWENETHKIDVDAENLTANALIALSLETFSHSLGVHLGDDITDFELFAARKDGARDDGLPSLDGNHCVGKTFIKRFFLAPTFKAQSMLNAVETKDTLSSIQSEFQVNGGCGRETSDDDTEHRMGFSFCQLFCLKR